MSHPLLTERVQRAIDRINALDAEAGEASHTDTGAVWEALHEIRDDLAGVLKSVDALQSEQDRWRERDEQEITRMFGMTSDKGRALAARLIDELGTSALTDTALSRLAMHHADAFAKSPALM